MLNEATSSRINAQCATIQTVRLFEVVRYIYIIMFFIYIRPCVVHVPLTRALRANVGPAG